MLCSELVLSFVCVYVVASPHLNRFLRLFTFTLEPRIHWKRCGWKTEVGPDPHYRSRLRQDSVFFVRTRIRSQNCTKNPDPDSLFNFGSSRSLCGHFWSKNMGKLPLDRWL